MPSPWPELHLQRPPYPLIVPYRGGHIAAMTESSHDEESMPTPKGHELRSARTTFRFASSKLGFVKNPVRKNAHGEEGENLIADSHHHSELNQTADPDDSPLQFTKVRHPYHVPQSEGQFSAWASLTIRMTERGSIDIGGNMDSLDNMPTLTDLPFKAIL